MALMKVSPNGRALIERNEGLQLEAYADPATGGDPWTIGYGDTGPDVVSGLVITKEEADRRLSDRLEREFGATVNAVIGTVPTTQNQFDAMVSLAYNIGAKGFRGSTVAHEHVLEHQVAAADAFLNWTRANGQVLDGLVRRRNEERALYLTPDAPEIPAPPKAPPAVDIHALVVMLQQALNDQASTGLVVDGLLGEHTLAAWRDWHGRG
jgi:lysozyme